MGKAWKYGDDVNTDEIIPARYLNTTDRAELARHCIYLDMTFHNDTSPGKLIERIDGDVAELSAASVWDASDPGSLKRSCFSMKGKVVFGALLVSVALSSQGFGFELLDRLLGLKGGGSCNSC